MVPRRWLPLLCVAFGALAVGCEPGPKPATPGTAPSSALPTDMPLFARHDARTTVAHSGLRRFDFAPAPGSQTSYIERITTDGRGHYAIEPVSLLESSGSSWEVFELVHRTREGFFFRYRDFQVRDPLLFARNWKTTRLGESALVAGRRCERYRIERTVGDPASYELSVDETGLVLASSQFDSAGETIASMAYESFQLDANQQAVVWHEPSNSEEALDLRSDIEAQIRAESLRPRLLPPGYGPLEASTFRNGTFGGDALGSDEERWLKLVYSDGIEPMFFMQRLSEPSSLADLPVAASDEASSAVVAYQVGCAAVIQGRVEGHELVVIGKASKAQLLDLIESSLPSKSY